jgi:hypothetical protein
MPRSSPSPSERRRRSSAQPIPLHWHLVRLGKRGKDLAAAVGVSEVWITYVRHGVPASAALRRKIAEHLGMSERELFEVSQ